MEAHHWFTIIAVGLVMLYLGAKNPTWVSRWGL
jgi:hypothetical protein